MIVGQCYWMVNSAAVRLNHHNRSKKKRNVEVSIQQVQSVPISEDQNTRDALQTLGVSAYVQEDVEKNILKQVLKIICFLS